MPKKLKRFLLRYHPPIGLGLETIQEDGTVEVVHKDLPDTGVTTTEDIMAQVDRIISEEEMLTKKRHRPALIQLLGRLYQIDVSSAEEEAPPETPPSGQKDKKGDTSAQDVLQEGCVVCLVGLKGDLVAFNGELGKLAKCNHSKKKYEVHMNSNGQEVKVRSVDHFVLVPSSKYGGSLVVGAPVVIRGLRNHIELNGCLGRVVECHEESHRYEVRAIESGQLFRVKQENLVPIDQSWMPPVLKDSGAAGGTNLTPRKEKAAASGAAMPDVAAGGGVGDNLAADEFFEAGSLVELQGLKTAMVYNGQSAEVLSVDRVRSRYEIRLNDGSVKTIRAENVRLVRASKSSPRSRRKEGGSKAADGSRR